MLDKERTVPVKALCSRSEIHLNNPGAYVDRLCSHFAEEGVIIDRDGADVFAKFDFGKATLRVRDGTLVLEAKADGEGNLLFLKYVLTSHLQELAFSEQPRFEWEGEANTSGSPSNFRELTVLRASVLTPQMVRVTFKGERLESFATSEHHALLFFPPEGLAAPEWPLLSANGTILWPSPDRRPDLRNYTLRRVDPAAGEVDVDFLLHGTPGPAARWARAATAGDRIAMMGPSGGTVPTTDWYLLVGDEAAIPAIARMIEELPADVQGTAIIEVSDDNHIIPLPTSAQVDVLWLKRSEDLVGQSESLVDAAKAIRFPSHGGIFAWVGAEAKTATSLRKYWRDTMGLKRHQFTALKFWKQGAQSELEGHIE